MSSVPERIARDEWKVYFAHVTEKYRSWQTTIEVRRDDRASQLAAAVAPLELISTRWDGSNAGGAVVIDAIPPPPDVVRHRIERPRSVWVSDTRPGAESTIFIESDDGTTTLIVLRRPVEVPP